MGFKVGDKVEVISEDCGTPKGTVLTVKRGPEGPVGDGNYYFEETRQIVLGKDLTLYKLTKNQRITALEKEVERIPVLEKEVESLKSVLAEILEIKKPTEIMKAIPSTVDEPPYAPIGFETVDKSPNQQRAEIIEKAKKFVEEHGEGFDYDMEEERIVIAGKVVKVSPTQQSLKNGVAQCHKKDVFNEHIGKAIALGRALGLDVTEFEQAVQPNEITLGMEVRNERDWLQAVGGPIYKGEIYKIAKNAGLNQCMVGSGVAQNSTIINDTNAIYGEVK
ncbi:MAG TPA: hypothetical protein VNQ57_11935 [Ureibacillus sp.]|nr:hypothetical protein [Ureibacillus sp.]